jgi:UDP-N-acetylmuramoyl-L-alanyl-D-glutamate--2,6-diaminopimelate ligase
MNLTELLNGFANVPEHGGLSVTGLSDDSRAVERGDLFIAVRGFGEQHGLSFLPQAIALGANAVIYEPHSDTDLSVIPAGFVAIAVDQLGIQLGDIVSRFYQQPSANMMVAGVTGTDGKSSVAWMLVDAWRRAGRQAALIGTLGNGPLDQLEATSHTTPLPLPLQRQMNRFRGLKVDCVAMEVSSHALEQNRVGGVAFDIAILTNLKRDHLDYHGTVEAYKAAKQKLFDRKGLTATIVNLDDEMGKGIVQRGAFAGEQVISFSLSSPEASLYASDIQYALSGLSFSLRYQGTNYPVTTRLVGRFNVENCLAVCAALLVSGVEIGLAIETLAAVTPPPGRMEQITASGKPIALIDYAHTPNALAQALNAARQHAEQQLWVVFGCGGDRDVGKRQPMAAAAEKSADVVVVTSDNPRTESQAKIFADIRSGFERPNNIRFIESRADAIDYALSNAATNDLVVIAGKGHENYQLIGDRRLDFSDREYVAEWMAA